MDSLKEQLISFETAKLAKELGFPILDELESRYFYNTSKYAPKSPHHEVDVEKNLYRKDFTWSVLDIKEKHYYEAPTQALLQKWMREEHRLHIEVWYNFFRRHWEFSLFNLKKTYNSKSRQINITDNICHATDYEEALESGLLNGLKWIKNNET